MADSGEQPEGEGRIGDYRVVALMREGARTRTYRAEQISIDRVVILEQLREEARDDARVVMEFLAEVRAKAAVDHPGIGSVYEAVDDGAALYYTREFLGGVTFEELREAGGSFPAAAIATFLRQIGSAMEYFEQQGMGTLPLEARHLFLGDHEVVRLMNLAVPGERGGAATGRDRQLVAELCLDLLQRGGPGATRASTLLHLMAEDEDGALSWTQVAHTARRLAQELSEGAKVASQAIKTGPLADWGLGPGRSRALLAMLTGLLLAAALGAGFLLTNRRPPPKARDLSAMVEIPGGPFLTQDGKTVDLPRFWIDAHEVTIAEYAAFLEVLDGLPAEKRGGYDHPDQPALKRDHIPDDWEAMLNAARSGATFEGLPIGPNHPVVRVDWWDAHAYANWKGGRLPSQEEWYAAAQDGEVAPGDRGPVDRLAGDVTGRGVHGMAGNVSEWVRDPAKNPAFPMNPKAPLCCGASFVQPRDGAQARRWLPSREIRRRDLGFRTVRETAP